MDPDARITLYGGGAIGTALLALGVVTQPLIAITGLSLIGSTLLVSGLFNQLSEV